jgi:hypothetical protein
MSNNYWDEDEDDNDTQIPNTEEGAMKQLRKAKRSDEKRIKELTEQLETFTRAQRELVIKKVLETNGVSPKAARLISRELEGDVTEEAVVNYLTDNAEVFGLEVQYEDAPANTLDRAALRQQDIVTQQAMTPDADMNMAYKIDNASEDELLAMIYSGKLN